MTFNDLQFKPMFDGVQFKPLFDGVVARVEYPNGYGASVVRHSNSAGGTEGLYELAVLSGGAFTGTSYGWLTPDDVTARLKEIAAKEN